jgi:two-component system NtrC family sensor kinase
VGQSESQTLKAQNAGGSDDWPGREAGVPLLSFGLEKVREAAYLIDEQARFRYVNQESAAILGYSREELLGLSVGDIDPDFPLERWSGHWAQLQAHGSLIFEGRHRAKDGRVFPVEINATYLEFEGSGYNLALVRDITEHKRAEAALSHLNRELRAISDCNQILMRADNEQALLEDICRIVCDEAGYRMAWVGYAEQDEAKTIRAVAWAGAGAEDGYRENGMFSWADTVHGHGPSGTAIRSGKSVCIQDFQSDPQAAPWRLSAVRCGYRSSIALPLKDEEERPFGVLNIYSTEAGAFNPDEIRLLEELSGDLAFGIKVLRARIERNRAEDALRGSESRYKLLLDSVTDYIYTVQVEDGHPVSTQHGPGCAAVTGYSADDYLADPGLWHRMVHEPDRDAVQKQAMRILSGEPVAPLEHRISHRDGNLRWVRNTSVPRYGAHGKLIAYDGLISDITERKQAEEALRGASLYSRNLIETSLDPLVTISAEGKITDLNLATERAIGLPRERIIGSDFAEYFTDPAMARAGYQEAFASGKVVDYPLALRHASGAVAEVLYNASVFRDGQGEVLGVFAAARDVTERKRAEEAARLMGQELQTIYDNTYTLFVYLDRDFNFLRVNRAYAAADGRTADFFVGKNHFDLYPNPENETIFRRVVETGQPYIAQAKAFEYPDHPEWGVTYWDWTLVPVSTSGTGVTGLIFTLLDVTERKRAEVEREQFHKFFQTSRDLMCIADPQGAFLKTNPAFTDTLGFSEAELASRPFLDFILPEDRQATIDELARQLQTGYSLNFENRYLCKDGSFRWLSWRAIFNKEEGTTYASARDITERKQAEETLRVREQEFRSLAENSPDNIFRYDRACRVIYANPQVMDALSFSGGALLGPTPLEAFPEGLYPGGKDEIAGYQAALERVIASGQPADMELHLPDPRGGLRTHSIRFAPERDADGQIVGALAFGRDITEQRRLEDQLRQSHKMEAVGQLAGGVAHDFNNILTAIMGFSNLAKMRMKPEDPQRPLIEQILTASNRAAHLTQGLLAFSRKQIIVPRPVDLNCVVNSMEKLLIRLIGEDVEFTFGLAPQSLIVMADAGQLEQVLMNLCTNARDAMPNGGTLALSTEEVALGEDFVAVHGYQKPGRYALITVSDSGHGMDESTRDKIFEPFFTTKERGKGTGLGLSIVFGIIKQHEGSINVYSEPGRGTTFKIYLPLIDLAAEDAHTASEGRPSGGTETILLAEDDRDVRTLTSTVLRDFGYTVIEAVDGQDAVETFKAHADRVNLLILDVIMPKMSGKEAHDAIKALAPAAKVLFISGYTADFIHKKGIFEEGIQFLPKPMSPYELLKKVRSILDGNR